MLSHLAVPEQFLINEVLLPYLLSLILAKSATPRGESKLFQGQKIPRACEFFLNSYAKYL